MLESDHKEIIREIIREFPDKSCVEISKLLNQHVYTISGIRNWMVRSGELKPLKKQKVGIKRKYVKRKVIEPKYTNANGIKKQQAREKIIDSIYNSEINRGNVLTLPFSTCDIELQMHSNKFHYIGCEREKQVYYEMLKTISNNHLNMSAHFGEVSDKIYSARENEYAHLILDYCGQISTFQEEIRYAIENNIVMIGGTISVTLCKRGELKGEIAEKIKALPFDYTCDKKLQTFAIETFFTGFAGDKYKVQTFMEYHDEGKMPMVLTILKRTK